MLKIHLAWNRFFRCCVVFIILFLLYVISTRLAFGQGSDWNVGKTIGLRAGTCIREGPGFTYHAHTRVPEDNWTVMVIDGPRTADGRTWWDTSRNAAGDPSGGTGWVTQDQADTNCDSVTAPIQPANPAPGNPGNMSDNPPFAPAIGQDWIQPVQDWWYQQSALIKWGVAVLALLFVSMLWRFVGGIIVELISAAFLAVLIWFILNLTRPAWQNAWESLASGVFGRDVPDLALLLGALPLASWGLSLILRSSRVRI